MEFCLRHLKGTFCFGWILAALTFLGTSWNAAVPVRADDGSVKRKPASASVDNRVADNDAPTEVMYVVDYEVADILSRIQNERHLDAEDAKEFLRNRVKGPPVIQFDVARQLRVRLDEPQWRDEVLAVAANRAGHEQIDAMLAMFRKFGIEEYAVSVRFVTLSNQLVREAFPDSTSSLLTMDQDQPVIKDAAFSPLPETLPSHDGVAVARVRTIIEEDAPMRFRVLDTDAVGKVLKAASMDRLSNSVEAPPINAYNEQTTSISDVAHSQFIVGANLLPSGEHEPMTRNVTEGTSMHLRPIRQSNGDIRLDFAASFTKIEKVTKEVLKIAADREITLQIPKVATCRVDGGVMLKPGQSLMFGSVKRLSEGRSESTMDKLLGRPTKREEQHLIVILQVKPYELPNHATVRVTTVAERN